MNEWKTYEFLLLYSGARKGQKFVRFSFIHDQSGEVVKKGEKIVWFKNLGKVRRKPSGVWLMLYEEFELVQELDHAEGGRRD